MQNITDQFPDISFIDDATLDEIVSEMISDYQEKYKELTNNDVSLGKANPYRLIMYAAAVQIYQGMQYADFSGKQSFLKYAREDYLDNLAALRGVKRMDATSATAELTFSIEAPIASAVSIPAGCKVTNGNEVYFATNEYAEIKAGQTSVTVAATCTDTGSIGNDLEAGELNTVVNTLPYIVSVSNKERTYGGADREDDESLKDRIFKIPNSYSTAGPSGGYEYHAKLADPTISDVRTTSPSAGVVEVCIVSDGGVIPGSAMINKVQNYLNDRTVRPLTDKVIVKAPVTSTYNIDLTYYIPSSSKAAVSTIQADVTTAVSIYNTWQTERIGRDINPSYLIQKVMEAGAKRVTVASPTFTVLNENTIAKAGTINIKYGGVEDD